MSLFKQMALTISFIIVILVGTVMVINYKSSKKNMMQNLYETTVNNISSLSSQLSTVGNNPAQITSIIDAEFDSGYFKKISFTSNDASFTYTKVDNDPLEDVPLWFINATDIRLQSITTDVSSGWSMLGVLSVEGDTASIYNALYKIFIQLLYIFLVSVIASLLILSIMLGIILKPLKGVQKQAEAIARNEFIIQKDVPYTQEFRDVVLGMNKMVTKMKAMFEKGNEALKFQQEREYTDKTTKLKNRKYLIDKLPEFLKVDAISKGGVSIMIALSGIIEANEKIGHKEVDLLFNAIANIFRETLQEYNEAIIARMNGTEFILFIPNCTSDVALAFAHNITKKSQEKIIEKGLNSDITLLSLGIYTYNHQESISTLLSQSDNALTQAKFKQNNMYLTTPSEKTEVMGKDAWRELIVNAIQKSQFHFVSWSSVDAKLKKVAHLALSLSIVTDKTYYYGQFMAPANQLGLSNDIYTTALTMLFSKPQTELHGTICSLRLPYEYVMLSNTYKEMQALFGAYATALPLKLIVEMPDIFLSQNIKLAQEYKKLLDKYNIDLGIFEFIGESKDYQYLQALRPSYIKGESRYFLSQSEQALSALRLITDSLEISLIASGVMQKEVLQELRDKDIHIIQGKATESIKLN